MEESLTTVVISRLRRTIEPLPLLFLKKITEGMDEHRMLILMQN
jgi:hypothetical protein